MRSRYFPWFLMFALAVILAAFIFLLLVANPGMRMPGPLSGVPAGPNLHSAYPLMQTTGRSRATRRASPARSEDSTTLLTSL